MKNIVDLRNDLLEVFEPLKAEEFANFVIDDFGALVEIQADGDVYFENETLLVVDKDNVFSVNKKVFASFRINICEDRCFTFGNYHIFNNFLDAMNFANNLANNGEVMVVTRNIFRDDKGEFNDICYYAISLEA